MNCFIYKHLRNNDGYQAYYKKCGRRAMGFSNSKREILTSKIIQYILILYIMYTNILRLKTSGLQNAEI